MPKLIDVTGQRFWMLVAASRVPNRGANTMWLFICDCGGETETYVAAVKRGLVRSCGCLHRAGTRTTHGKSHSPTFRSWAAAKGRCTNPRNAAWADYGGRGIQMCPEWAASFEAFLAAMGERPDGRSLDRIDNSRGYEPGNCGIN